MTTEVHHVQWADCSHYWTNDEGTCLLCDRQKNA